MNPDTNDAISADDQPPAIPVPGSVVHPAAPSEPVAPATDPLPPEPAMPEAPPPIAPPPPLPAPVMPPVLADPTPAPAPVIPPADPAPLPPPPLPATEPAPMPPLPAGAPISAPAASASVPGLSANSGSGSRFAFNPRSLLKWVGIGVGVIVILVVGFIVITTISVNSATAGAVTAGDSFIKAAQANDAAAAYELTSDNFRAVVPANQMGALLTTLDQSIIGKSSVVSRSVSNKSGETTKAAIVYRFDGGAKAYFRINAEKANGKWQIINYRASETALDAELE